MKIPFDVRLSRVSLGRRKPRAQTFAPKKPGSVCADGQQKLNIENFRKTIDNSRNFLIIAVQPQRRRGTQ